MKRLASILTLSIIILTSCQKKLSLEKDIKALEQLNKKWNDNIISGNRAANADFFTEDGIRIEGKRLYFIESWNCFYYLRLSFYDFLFGTRCFVFFCSNCFFCHKVDY